MGLNPKLKFFVQEVFQLLVLRKLTQLKRISNGGQGHSHGGLQTKNFEIKKKIAMIFNTAWITFCTFLEQVGTTKRLK